MPNFGTYVNIVSYDKYDADSMSWMNYYVGMYRKDIGSWAAGSWATGSWVNFFVELVKECVFFKWELATRGTKNSDRSSKVDGMRMHYVSIDTCISAHFVRMLWRNMCCRPYVEQFSVSSGTVRALLMTSSMTHKNVCSWIWYRRGLLFSRWLLSQRLPTLQMSNTLK